MSRHSPEEQRSDVPPTSDRRSANLAEVDRIFREYGPFIWRTLRRLGIAESDVDDAVQEVFVVVHRKLDGFEERSHVRTWLYGIAVRVAAAQRRRAHVRREVPTEEVASDAVAASNPEESAREREALVLLDRALDGLDGDKRAVFVLYEIEGLEMAQVAEALGCPLQTAYSRLHSARKEVEKSMRRAMLGKVTT